jgi:putative lipoic acid-binding regulatory protein
MDCRHRAGNSKENRMTQEKTASASAESTAGATIGATGDTASGAAAGSTGTAGIAPQEAPSLIEYPSDFPIKIMGPTHDEFAPTMFRLVREHDPLFTEAMMEVRPSGKGNYLGLTVTVRATSREQLDNLYRALSGHPMVKVVM